MPRPVLMTGTQADIIRTLLESGRVPTGLVGELACLVQAYGSSREVSLLAGEVPLIVARALRDLPTGAP